MQGVARSIRTTSRWSRSSWLLSERFSVSRDLGLQRCRQHLPRTITDDLIQQRPRTGRGSARRVGVRLLLDYLERVRTVPSWRANANPDQIAWASNLAREGTPVYVTSPESHPEVLGELPDFKRLPEKAP